MNELSYAPPLKRARVEIIPLIDVIFFLLATFVLFTLSLNRITAIETQLPVAGRPGPEDNNVYIQASEPGTFYWKQGRDAPAELFSTAELPTRLTVYKNSTPSPTVFIRGDNKAKYGSMVLVLDEARHAGIKRVSIETTTSPSVK